MGTFIGHAAPGAFFIVFSIWWMIQYAYTRVALDNGRQRPRSRILFILHRLPVEGTFIVLCAIGGFIGEMMYPAPKWTLIGSDGNWKHPNEWQHCTMYTYFGIYGAVNIMARTCLPAAAPFEKVFGALAFAIEGMLFFFHTHGREELDVQLHFLLVIAIFACFLTTAAEVWRKEDRLLPLFRFVFTMLQGTWFWHVGIVLYWPPSGEQWDQDSHLNLMFTTVMFTWHLLIDMLVLLFVYGCTSLILRVCGLSSVRYSQMNNGPEEMEVKLLGNKDAGNHLLAGSDSE
ncbi:transmembrane protein 45B-like [Diadema setosum]|uniref:transmembrane protein 45B-like n=1 Tax=Diadema setosum TaxID=31175 RepID=UPI003B3A3C2D